MCCALHCYILQAIWNASPTKKRIVWDLEQALTVGQYQELLGIMNVPFRSLLADSDIGEIYLDPEEARKFIMLWVKARLAVKNPTELDDLEKVRNAYLDVPVSDLRNALLQVVPWFFRQNRASNRPE